MSELKDPKYYCVIANHTTVWGIDLEDSFNRQTGFSDKTFYEIFDDVARRLGIDVEHRILDYMVLKGSLQALDMLAKEYGQHFSFSVIDRNSLHNFLGAMGEYMLEHGEHIMPEAAPKAFS